MLERCLKGSGFPEIHPERSCLQIEKKPTNLLGIGRSSKASLRQARNCNLSERPWRRKADGRWRTTANPEKTLRLV